MNVETPAGTLPASAPPAVPSARTAPVDQAAAAVRCESLLQDSLDAVRPPLTWRHGAARAGARLPLPGSGPDDAAVHWYVGRSRDIVTIVSAARRAALPAMVETQWRRRGWTVTSVNAGCERPGLAAITPDGYRLALEFGELGEVRLTAVSPGVARSERPEQPEWSEQSGRPEQSERPAGSWGEVPGSPGYLARLPEVCCPFWSAMG
ncbi:hypothetical protein J5Y04_30350 [Kitasatospora sp. RG8]|uniref:hypothetical protein n=1 Tax=Kitasatospora sp. RG8 TaxID=2820815 RepID=UPI001ADF6BDC|nr:hypothetical protein [Kitasatospora sp. RG8]MBP0453812.1 hypothetical protein [Kitasatospora sp. RG8]